MTSDAESQRMAARDAGAEEWRIWGSYLSDRQWGTVREDYSADGDARCAIGQAERGALELGQAAVGDAAEFLDEPAMKPEIRAQHLWDREREMPVRHGREDGLGQQCAEELDFLLVAGGAQPAALERNFPVAKVVLSCIEQAD